MNTGMQDAINLAWKLAMVVHGDARESLLDSYSPERNAVGDMVLRNASALTDMATLTNPAAQAAHNLVARFLLGFHAVWHEMAATMVKSISHTQRAHFVQAVMRVLVGRQKATPVRRQVQELLRGLSYTP